jgi:hypothetical protein
MKVEVSEQSIKHLVDSDCVDMVVGHIRKLEAENARLKAEVERYRRGGEKDGLYDPLTALELFTNMHRDEKAAVACLKAKVKRLTNAGDAIISQWNKYGLVEAQLRLDWHAAKGVQS